MRGCGFDSFYCMALHGVVRSAGVDVKRARGGVVSGWARCVRGFFPVFVFWRAFFRMSAIFSRPYAAIHVRQDSINVHAARHAATESLFFLHQTHTRSMDFDLNMPQEEEPDAPGKYLNSLLFFFLSTLSY
jgi:hypothetical protein